MNKPNTSHIRWGNRQWEFYSPKAKKWKQGLLLGFVGLCLVTPGTNWMIFGITKAINKFNPLWIYN